MNCKASDKIVIQLIQISSPDHYALWNALSIETLAGYLKGEFGERVETKINRICSSKEIEYVLDKIKTCPPHILGISVEIGSLEWTKYFFSQYEKLKFDFNERPLVVIGNKLPTYFPEYFIEIISDAIVVIGEGEEALRGLVEYVAGNGNLDSIPNLAYMAAHGSIKKTFEKPVDMNRLIHPPSTDTIPQVIFRGGNALLQASRGCTWSQCSYCTIKSFRKGNKWEGLPVKRVLKNIEDVVALGVTELEFADDEFFGGTSHEHLQRIYSIAEGIEHIRNKSGKDITFRIFLIPHTIYKKNKEAENQAVKRLILRLKDVGLVKIYFGAESGCPSQLHRYRRGYTIEELETVIRILRDELSMEIDVGFVMFDPHLSIYEIIANIAFFRKWNLVKSNQWPFRPLVVNAGSHLYNHLKGTNQLQDVDLNYMSYYYRFLDKDVQEIYMIIDTLSQQTRAIFYALKTISKRQYSPSKKDAEILLAQKYVEANANIFLDAMENLAKRLIETSSDSIETIVHEAKQDLDELIYKISNDIEEGRISKRHVFLSNHVYKHLEQLPALGITT